MVDTVEFIKTLPYNTWLKKGEPWVTAPTCYPLYTRAAEILRPYSILEVGAYEGLGLVAFLLGNPEILHLSWIDNQSYSPTSNRACKANLEFTLKKLGMSDVGLYPSDRMSIKNYHQLIHVDGDHSLGGTLLDLTWAYCQNPAYILVDDFLNDFIPGVAQAVKYFAGRFDLPFKVWKTYRGWAVFSLHGREIPDTL